MCCDVTRILSEIKHELNTIFAEFTLCIQHSVLDTQH